MIWREEGGSEEGIKGIKHEDVWAGIWGKEMGEMEGLGEGITPESVYDLVTA